MPAINNFGYLWDRDRVFWGRPKVNGTLLGSHPRLGVVDFREQKGIYLLHTRDFKVIYVGQVGAGDQTLLSRLRHHTRSEDLWNRWQYFSWFGWRSVNKGGKTPQDRLAKYGGGSPKIYGRSEEFLDEIEAVIIQVVEPTLNKQGPKWKDTLQFEQYNDSRLELSDPPTIAEKQARILEELGKLSEQLNKSK